MNQNELMHFGVKGMKWGHHKASPTPSQKRISNAKTEYKLAKKDVKLARKEYSRARRTAFSADRVKKAQDIGYKLGDAELKRIDAKAKYKASKAKSLSKAEKAEFKTYRKEMQKSGIVGSVSDASHNGRSTAIYNHLTIKKGQAYADAINRKVDNIIISQFCTASAVTIGATAVQYYLNNK